MQNQRKSLTQGAPASPCKRTLLSLTIIALASAGSAVAEEDKDVLELNTIRVLGEGSEGYNVALTADMIEARQASDLEDLFRFDPSITVGGGAPIAQKIYVRGLEDTLLNVTIDGATQAGYLYHHQGRVSIEPELIKDIVIKPGAGNAADGAGALGGAIHFNLKDAKDMLRGDETGGVLVKSSVNGNNQGWKKHISAYQLLNDDVGLLASFTENESQEDYKDGRGDRVDETEQFQQDIRLKLSGDFAEDHYFSMSYEDYLDEGVRYSRPNMGALFHPAYENAAVDQKTDRESWIGNYKYNPQNDWIDLSTTVYYNDSSIEKRGDRWADPFPTFVDVYNGEWHGGGVESIGFDLRNTSVVDDHSFEYGVEYREDNAYLINPLNPFNHEETDVFALFLQADVALSDAVRLSTGARYDDYDYTDNGGTNIADSKISPNATLSVEVTDGLELSVGYAKAFKGVSSPEVFYLEDGRSGGSFLSSYTGADTMVGDFAAGELKAEESDNLELAFKYDAGDFAASGELYRQKIKNAQTIDSSWNRYSYLDDVEVTGYALRVAYYFDELIVNAGVSHSKPELNGEPLSSGDMGLGTSYGRTWVLGFEYDFSDSVMLGWDARFVERLTDVQDGQGEKAGYAVHDFFAEWKPNDDLSVGFAVNNVFDKFFYDQGTYFSRDSGTDPYGLPEPGRELNLYASYQF